MNKTLTLVYDPICPFAQTAWLTLLEKGLPFEKMKVDLKNKSKEFTQIYRRAQGSDPESDGKVPALVHGDRAITESDIICWYLQDEFKTQNTLIPKDSLERVRMRLFIQNVAPKFVSAFYSVRHYQKKSEEEQKNVRDNITNAFNKLEESIKGPYVLGQQATFADLFVYPWLERWCVQESLFGIPIPEDCKKVKGLKAAFEKRPSVQKTKEETSDDFFIQTYKPYFTE